MTIKILMRTIRHFIDKRAEEHPQKVYLIAPEPHLALTYARLRDDAILFGKQLVKMGLRKGDKVSFMMPNGYQTCKVFLGTMYSGLVAAPLNLQAQPSQLEYVVRHSDTNVIFVMEEEQVRLMAAVKAAGRPLKIIPVDPDAERKFPKEDLSQVVLPEVDEEDPALLLYTSGTTGTPKGVILRHRNLLAGAEYTALAHKLTENDRALCSLPLYHINAEVVSALAPLVSGGSVVMPRRFSASQFWSLLSEYRCTWFSVVPTILSYLVSATEIEGRGYHLEQVRFGRSASSALPLSLHRTFEEKFKISIVETMGLTETAAPVFSNPLDPRRRKYGSPGQAVGNEAKIADKAGNEVPRGMVGEILVRGDNVMKEYYKDPEATAMTLEPDGWLHTGDLGFMDEEGFVFVTGRLKELIIKGGENISPREIDEVLYRHPAVLDAAAVGIPDEHYGEEILACVCLRSGETCTEADLLAHCERHLGRFKTPKRAVFMDDLPKGPSGKIRRLELPRLCGYERTKRPS